MNRCEKYADCIEDAAMGALAPEREREFVAHTAECGACREAYQRAREVAAAMDRGVESLVAGEPSPHFAVRLRARIAEEPSRARVGWLTWKPIAAAFVAAGVLAFVLISRTPRHPSPEPAAIRSAAEAASIERPSKPNPTTTQTQVRRGYHALLEHRAEMAKLVSPRRPGVRRAVSAREPEVIVPPGQLEAVIRFAAEIHSGRINGKQLIAADPGMTKPLTIAPIVIAPLEKPQSDTSDSSGAPVDSGHR
jgi:hypothetical protein